MTFTTDNQLSINRQELTENKKTNIHFLFAFRFDLQSKRQQLQDLHRYYSKPKKQIVVVVFFR